MFRWPGKTKDETWILGDYTKQNGLAPMDAFKFYFTCRDCDVRWQAPTAHSTCWSCGKQIGKPPDEETPPL